MRQKPIADPKPSFKKIWDQTVLQILLMSAVICI